MRLLVFAGYIALTIYCLTDMFERPERRPHGVPKWLWVVLIAFTPLIGVVVWLVLKYRPHPPERSEQWR